MLLTCEKLSKSYGGARALSGIDLEIAAGEVHGLVGANGAGKSTLVKILAGALPDHEGSITFEGAPVRLSSPHEALARGIAVVYQELSGIGALSVAENLFLGRQPVGAGGFIRWGQMHRRAAEMLSRVGLSLDVTRRLDSYPLSIRQQIEIARCLDAGSRLFILDEPTSALSAPETRRLFDLIRQIRASGKSVLFVSHFIEDVLEVCDRVTVLVGGRKSSTRAAAELTRHEVIEAMLGAQGGAEERAEEEALESEVSLPPASDRPELLEAANLSRLGYFRGINLRISPGECLGLYGFVGAGHQELAHCLAGATHPDDGRILWEGNAVRLNPPAMAVKRGIALVAGDRARALIHSAEIYKNITLTHLKRRVGEWVTPRHEIAAAAPILQRVGCRPADPMLHPGALSGGNQQKVVLGRWLLGPIRLLILEEPTRGMDVAAKREVMEIVGQLKREGTAVLLASCEPELVLAHGDRILVMRRGEVTTEFTGCRVGKADLMRHG